jgi:hypothetical protein
MKRAEKYEVAEKAFQLPVLAVGDVLLVGKFKNRRVTITGFSLDENNQPVAQTDKGEHKIFKPRIAKLMPSNNVRITAVSPSQFPYERADQRQGFFLTWSGRGPTRSLEWRRR